MFFFFKQKTAYEMRISDWSSDVCSSDLLASAFGSVYAAYGLYDLLAPLIAFLLLALVAFAAFALALLHGPFIAVLALLGGFLTPLLVASPEPAAWGLFAYLLALSAAALAVTQIGRASCRERVCQYV